jgi:hypothetical protein
MSNFKYISLFLFVFSYFNATSQNLTETLQLQRKTENIFLINTGLDVVYMGSGLLLRNLAEKNIDKVVVSVGYNLSKDFQARAEMRVRNVKEVLKYHEVISYSGIPLVTAIQNYEREDVHKPGFGFFNRGRFSATSRCSASGSWLQSTATCSSAVSVSAAMTRR